MKGCPPPSLGKYMNFICQHWHWSIVLNFFTFLAIRSQMFSITIMCFPEALDEMVTVSGVIIASGVWFRACKVSPVSGRGMQPPLAGWLSGWRPLVRLYLLVVTSITLKTGVGPSGPKGASAVRRWLMVNNRFDTHILFIVEKTLWVWPW